MYVARRSLKFWQMELTNLTSIGVIKHATILKLVKLSITQLVGGVGVIIHYYIGLKTSYLFWLNQFCVIKVIFFIEVLKVIIPNCMYRVYFTIFDGLL